MKISVCVNQDTRPGNNEGRDMFDGVRNHEIMVQSLIAIRRFFQGFDIELLTHVDIHEPVPSDLIHELMGLSDSLTLRKHSKYYRGHDPFQKFNDISFLNALSQARGDVIVHLDGDSAIFAKDPAAVQGWLDHLETRAFVSYPCVSSPDPVVDENFDCWWVSTRAFACKRENLLLEEWERCLMDVDYLTRTHGEVKRNLNWLEHCIGRVATSTVVYPPLDNSRLMIACWGSYVPGIFTKLNQISYDEVHAYVVSCGGILYPNNIYARPL